ncbi:hypothetical protein ACA910_005604 [Epithemia clementina (nom. ined.)]
MSRAALWRQEGNVKERERRAEELFETALEEGRERAARSKKSILPLWGPDSSFHWNPLLLRNTIHSPYFQKCCQNLTDWNAVIDEIYYEVKQLQPFSSASDKTPSTAFCLLLRLLTLRMTDHQMDLTLQHADSPYIRAIGFLYLRYAGPPDQIIRWIQPYLYDDEELIVEASGSPTITMGEFVRDLFQSRDFHGTPLPRFPLEVERSIQVMLLQAEQVADRAARHLQSPSLMAYFQTLGNQVMALYGDDENPVTWYKAVVDRVITRDEATGALLRYPKFVVTFPEYGNTETVLLGELDSITDGTWNHDDPNTSRSGNSRGTSASLSPSPERANWDRQRGGGVGHRPGGRGRHENNNHHHHHRRAEVDLYDEVRRRERDTATAANKGGWARRPPTTKNALSSQTQRGRHSVQDDEAHVNQRNHHSHSSSFSKQQRPREAAHGDHDDRKPSSQCPNEPDDAGAPTSRKRSAEEVAAIQQKKRNLMAKYG